MTLFHPNLRAAQMTVGTATVVLQMSEEPVIFGCAERVARRLCRCTAGKPAVAVKIDTESGPQFCLTPYGVEVKAALEKWISLR